MEAFEFVKSAMSTDDDVCSIPARGRARHLPSRRLRRDVSGGAELYEATGAPSYLECARRWVERRTSLSRSKWRYFFTADDANALIARAKMPRTRPPPATACCCVLAQLYHLTGEGSTGNAPGDREIFRRPPTTRSWVFVIVERNGNA
jgi:uncharacterized protein YyaL (SSP411 family)